MTSHLHGMDHGIVTSVGGKTECDHLSRNFFSLYNSFSMHMIHTFGWNFAVINTQQSHWLLQHDPNYRNFNYWLIPTFSIRFQIWKYIWQTFLLCSYNETFVGRCFELSVSFRNSLWHFGCTWTPVHVCTFSIILFNTKRNDRLRS